MPYPARRMKKRTPGRSPAGFLLYVLLLGTGLAILALAGAGCGRKAAPAIARPERKSESSLYTVATSDGRRLEDFDLGAVRLEGEINAALARRGIEPLAALVETRRVQRRVGLGNDGEAIWVEVDKRLIASGPSGRTVTEYALAMREAASRAGAAVLSEKRESGLVILELGTELVTQQRRQPIVLFRLHIARSESASEATGPSKRASSGVDAAGGRFQGTPRAAIIIDDWGGQNGTASAMLELPLTLNMAVIPFTSGAHSLARAGLARGWEVLVHLPMQPLGSKFDVGPGLVRVNMSNDEIVATTRRSFDDVPGADGTNNHMGSRATADSRVMSAVLGEVRSRGWFFIDSRTTSHSVIPETARDAGVPYGINSIFLDGEDRHGFEGTVEYVEAQLQAMLRLARSRGAVIAIGHVRPATVEALRRFSGMLSDSGVQLVPVRDLVSLEYPLMPQGGRGNHTPPGVEPTPTPAQPAPATPPPPQSGGATGAQASPAQFKPDSTPAPSDVSTSDGEPATSESDQSTVTSPGGLDGPGSVAPSSSLK